MEIREIDRHLAWLALSRIKGIGNKTLQKISTRNRELGIGPKDFWQMTESEMKARYNLSSRLLHSISVNRDRFNTAQELLRELERHKVKIVTLEETDYPEPLRRIPNPPFLVYLYGDMRLLSSYPVAIAGSRNISPKGLMLVYGFSQVLREQGQTIIRGTKFDVDILPEMAARRVPGYEIIIPSEGILTFLKRVEKNNGLDPTQYLIIGFVNPRAEWGPGIEAMRNSILFALSQRIIIVEAREDGFIIKEGLRAIKEGKGVFVVRFDEYPANAVGNRVLIEAGGVPISPEPSVRNLKEVIQAEKRIAPSESNQRNRKELGQFFTPRPVVEFIYEMVNIILEGEVKPLKILDPACGEGIFLKYALNKGIAGPDDLYGCDVDEAILKSWESLGIRSRLKLFIHHGLLDRISDGIEPGRFDLVIGNPPYGGIGLSELVHIVEEQDKGVKDRQTTFIESETEQPQILKKTSPLSPEKRKELIDLANQLGRSYELWRRGDIFEKPSYPEPEEPSVLTLELPGVKRGKKWRERIAEEAERLQLLGKKKDQVHLSKEELKRLLSFPIEVLFLERFIQLARPGGLIAIIIPDGILANVNLRYVQEWIFEHTRVLAIISLPRQTFKLAGTTSKTSILFLRNLQKDEPPDKESPIFMAGAEYVGIDKEKNDLPEILKNFKEFMSTRQLKESHMSPFFGKATGEDVLRTGRMDPEYWDPKYTELIKVMGKASWQIKPIGKFIEFITYGSTKPREWSRARRGVKYIKSVNVKETGLDEAGIFYTPEGGRLDGERYRVFKNDVIVNKSGVGTFGRSIVLTKDYGKMVVSQHTMVIRLKGLSSYYAVVFLKTKFGFSQIERYALSSVSGQAHIDFDEFKSIQIPLLPNSIQQKTEREYKKMSRWHDKAMEVKKKLIDRGLSNKEAEKDPQHQRCIQISEAMLKDLIKRTEEVIEGKRKEI